MDDALTVYCPAVHGFVVAKDGRKSKCTHVKCDIRHERGEPGARPGQDHAKGYYLHITPVTREGRFERSTGSTGGKVLLVGGRKGPRRAAIARAECARLAREAIAGLFETDGVDMSPLPGPPVPPGEAQVKAKEDTCKTYSNGTTP